MPYDLDLSSLKNSVKISKIDQKSNFLLVFLIVKKKNDSP